MVASDTNNQSNKTVETIGNNTVITYTFSNVNGGFTLDVPVKFTNQDYVTPGGYQLPIQAQVYEEGSSVPLDTKELVYNYTLKEMSIQKYVYSTSWNTSDGTVVYGGEEDVNKPGYISSDISKTAKVRFSIDNKTNSSANGNRTLEKYIIEDRIPDGAVFLPEDNPNWTYDETTRTARLEKTGEIKNNASFSHDIYLRFPGAKVDEAITNVGNYTGIPKNKPEYEQQFNATDPITIKLSSKKPNSGTVSTKKTSSNWRLYDDPNKPEEKERWEVKWSVGATINNATEGVYNFKIRDYNLDNRMKYTKVVLPQTTNFQNSVSLKLLKDDGQEQIVANDIDLSQQSFNYEVPSDISIKEIILEGKAIDGNKGYNFEIYSKLKNPSDTHIPEGSSQTTFYNYMQAVLDKEGQSLSGTNSDYARLEKIGDPLVKINKRQSGNYNLFLNDTTHFSLSLNSSNLGTNFNRTSMALENVSIIDLLPLGAEYVEDSAAIGSLSTNKNEELKEQKSPKVIHDYKNTGRTALIWSIKDFKIETSSTLTSDTTFLRVDFDVKTTKNSLEGKNTNESFLLFNSSDGIKPNLSGLTEDTYHIGTDGSNKILGSSDYFNYTPPKELITYKEVKGDADEGIIKAPGKGHTEVGGTGIYYLNVFNNSEYDQSILNIIDQFPHIGDKSSSKDKEGNRNLRNSEFSIKLSGPISGPEGYQIYYTTDKADDSSEDTKSFFKNASWQTKTSDYQKVTAIKIVMDNGKKLKAGDSIKFEVPFSVPNDKTLIDKVAINSFGTATNSGLDFFESNNSAVTLMKYKVDGYLFNDKNKDGKFDKVTEKGFSNQQVELLNEAGQPVLNEAGEPIRGITDSSGYYSIDVFKKGNYQIKATTPENYLITTKILDKELGSHLNPTGDSDVFALNIANPTHRVNGGYFIDPEAMTQVTVTKNWEDANNQDGKRPNSIQVQLKANGEKQGEPVTLTAANNWTTTWNDLAQKAKGQEIAYTVEEVAVPGYTTTVDDTDKGNVKITNTHTPETTEVKGTKTWADNDNQDGKRPDKITVNLLADGEQVATKEVTEADGWQYSFTNLPKFKDGQEIVYTVTENKVLNYTTKIEGYNIINTYSPGEISGTVTKHWEDGNDHDGIRPESIKIQLYANGEAHGEPVKVKAKDNWTYTWEHLPITNKDGKVIHYSIKEIEVADGYTATISGENIGNLLITNTHNPVTPNKPDQPTKPEGSTMQKVKKWLPKTGEEKVIWLTIIGVFLICSIGGYLYFRKKVKR
ncbi:Cna B-type domain-containing protein [Enterococcus faecalis]|nr:Cna B-type domain-containing protein [Enterococcus faecalis]